MNVDNFGPSIARLTKRISRSLEYRRSHLWSRVMCEIKERGLPRAKRLDQQLALYASLGLNRTAGLEAYGRALEETGLGFFGDHRKPMSENKALFGALATSGGTFRKILEIGTLEGRSALILAHLFPNAVVSTIDLPTSDPVYQMSYEHARADEFIRRRNSILDRSNRIRFIEVNSLRLSLETVDTDYDLIWVDGDHDFPVVGIDLANAVRLLRPGGFLMCDDVITEKVSKSSTYNSNAAHQSLRALHLAGLIVKPVYLFKRLEKRDQHPRKYVAITRRQAENRAM